MLNADDRSGTQAHVYLIGDATFDFVPGLQRLLYRSHKPLLQAFFGSVYRVLRSEIAKTASVQRVQFPRFTSVQDLLTLQRHDGLHPALHNALICTFQLASFIRCVKILLMRAKAPVADVNKSMQRAGRCILTWLGCIPCGHLHRGHRCRRDQFVTKRFRSIGCCSSLRRSCIPYRIPCLRGR